MQKIVFLLAALKILFAFERSKKNFLAARFYDFD